MAITTTPEPYVQEAVVDFGNSGVQTQDAEGLGDGLGEGRSIGDHACRCASDHSKQS